jgi:EAL domain-containing protein (putative c-di-GMP-specific phosphodiesterase class I)/GGDEF domain-containing protein
VPSDLDTALTRALQQASRLSRPGALILIRSDRAAELALTLPAGLQAPLQQAISHHLAHALARLPGHGARAMLVPCDDGFAAILPVLIRTDEAEAAAETLLRALDRPVDLGGYRIALSGHAGIGIFPNDGDRSATLLDQARLALQEAARLDGPVRLAWTLGIREHRLRRLRLETALRQALSRSGFELRFEPQADLGTGALTGIEVRLHWHDSELGLIRPADWQAVAEAGRLTAELERWTLGQACHQIRVWRSQGLEVPRLSVAISTVSWLQSEFVSSVLHTLVDHGLPGGVLTLTLDGDTLCRDEIEPHRRRIAALRAAGVHIGVTQNGRGHLPLARLAQLPLDELRLDRHLLASLDGAGLGVLGWLTGLARTLNLRVLADGVENDTQIDALRRLHCDEFQGSLLTPPLDADATGQLLMHARVQQRLVLESQTLALPVAAT